MTNHCNVEAEETTTLPQSVAGDEDRGIDTRMVITSDCEAPSFEVECETPTRDDVSHLREVSDLEKYCDKETMSYVVGSIIKRIGCEACANKLAHLRPIHESKGFTYLMTFEKGHLFEPLDCVISSFMKMIPRILNFLRKKFFQRNIAEKASMFLKDNFEELHFCQAVHSNHASKLFVTIVLKTFLREKNEKKQLSKCKSSAGKLKHMNI